MPELFPGMDVRKMNLNGRHPYGGDGITEGDAGMGIGGGIEDDDIELALGFLNPIYQLAFEV